MDAYQNIGKRNIKTNGKSKQNNQYEQLLE